MYHTTGLDRADIVDLAIRVQRHCSSIPGHSWPPRLGLYKSLVVALTYLRRNRVQAEIAETYGVSQSTVSRAITRLTPILARILADRVPVAEDLDRRQQYIVDGSLLPCWSWADHPELYSGKHKTTGLNIQVACDLSGTLVWVSDPASGSTHDITAVRKSGILDADFTDRWIADKGYLGSDTIHPIRKPISRALLNWEKRLNTDINRIRYKIEQAIAHLKTWRILHTDYRRPLNSFATTITAALGLEFMSRVGE